MTSFCTEHIIGVMEHAIDTYSKYHTGVRNLYEPRVFRQTMQTTRIELPRQSGTTTAAIEFVKRHPDTILIHINTIVDQLKKEHVQIADNILTTYQARNSEYKVPVKVVAKLKGLDAVIIDTVDILQADLNYIYETYNPKQVFILGGTQILN